MASMKKWIFFSLLLGLALSYFYGFAKHHLSIVSDHFARLNYPELLFQSKSLPTFGFVQQKPNGIGILKVSDHYIDQLYPMLDHILRKNEKRCLRPNYTREGAHITLYGQKPSLFSRGRYHFKTTGIFKETIIKKFYFFTVYKTYYQLAVQAPKLAEVFRIDHPGMLHISIGISERIGNTRFCLI